MILPKACSHCGGDLAVQGKPDWKHPGRTPAECLQCNRETYVKIKKETTRPAQR